MVACASVPLHSTTATATDRGRGTREQPPPFNGAQMGIQSDGGGGGEAKRRRRRERKRPGSNKDGIEDESK